MTILVSGGAGFIGSHVVDALVAQGEDVVVVDDLSSGDRSYLPPEVAVEVWDVADPSIEDRIARMRPQAIVHAAAQVSVPAAVRDPSADARSNIIGSIRVASAAIAGGCDRFVFLSTGGAIYGHAAVIPTPEGEPAEPISPYGIGKLAAEHYLRAILGDQVSLAILRLANVYGPRQGTSGEAGVIAIMLRALIARLPITIDGDGEQTRDFVFVEDVADAVATALRGDRSGTWNIGTGRELSINALFSAISALSEGHRAPEAGLPRAMDVRRSCLDPTRAKRELGWSASTPIQEGLRRTSRRLASRHMTSTSRPRLHAMILNQYALPPGAGGITRNADLGIQLIRYGHAVTIIAADFDYLRRTSARRIGREDISGLGFRWLDCGSYADNDHRRVRSMLSFAWRSVMAGLRVRPRPDVIVGSSPQLLAGLSGLVLARVLGRPFVFEIRDPWPSALVDLGAMRVGGVSHRVLGRIERQLYRSADRIITVMEHLDDRVAEVGEDPTKCVHIPNASTLPPPFGELPPTLGETLRRESQDQRVIVTYLGAQGVSNGLDDVVDAINLLRSDDRDAYDRLALFLIGGGPGRAALERRVEADGHTHIHFHDSISKPAAFSAIAASDAVLVHFARADYKRFGMSANKLFDAMAVGRPVLVATPLADTPVDIVDCGIRYEPGSPRALAATLARAVRLPVDERTAMGERGQSEARRRYNLEVTGRQLEELLREVVAKHRH